MGLFLAGLACAFLALVLSGRGTPATRRASLLALALAYGAPAAFVAHTLADAQDDGERYRFALLGLGFRVPPGEEELRLAVGGDRDRHDVFISALDEGTAGASSLLGHLVLEAAGDTGPTRVSFEPAPETAQGLLGLRPRGQPIRPYSALELADGDRLRSGGRVFTIDFDTGVFGAPVALVGDDGDTVELPRRVAELPLGLGVGIRRPLTAEVETYPLAWLLRTAEDDAPSGTVLDVASGFLFWEPHGLLGRRLWVAAAAESVAVERGGEVLPWPARAELSDDAAVHVLSPPRWNGTGQRAGGLRDRRSFRLDRARRSVSLVYETPEVYVLGRSALMELVADDRDEALADGERSPTLRLHLAMGGWQVSDRSLYFRHASQRVALEALATLELPRSFDADPLREEASFVVATPRGQRRLRFGEAFWLGRDHLAAVRLDVLRPPLLLAGLAVLMALLKVAAARSAEVSALHVLLIAPLEVLVSLRLLAGYRAWVLPPFSIEAFELALVAWALLPWVLLAASIPVPRGRRLEVQAALPAWGGALFAVGWCAAFGGGLRGGTFLAAILGAALLGGARALGAGAWLARLWERLRRVRASEARVLAAWTAAAFVPSVLRLLLLVLGYRESLLVGGQRFALTLVHIPLGLVLAALYLLWLRRRLEERGGLVATDLVPGLAIVAGTWVVPALVVGDLGLALLNVPVFLLAWSSFAWGARRQAEDDGLVEERWWADRRFWTHAAPAVLLAFYLVFAAFPLGARALLAVIPEETALELESERSYLRLLAFAYPDSLEKVARRGSEELAVMSAVMRSYTSGPWGGRGYFGSEVSPHIAATALREHAPAVFVAAEWGLLGTFGLVLCFLVAIQAGFAAAPWRGREPWHEPWYEELDDAAWLVGAAAAMAALTLGVASLYMVLANYRLTLFTGKNVYLLGLDSTADVLEVFLLTVVFALGGAVLRDEGAED